MSGDHDTPRSRPTGQPATAIVPAEPAGQGDHRPYISEVSGLRGRRVVRGRGREGGRGRGVTIHAWCPPPRPRGPGVVPRRDGRIDVRGAGWAGGQEEKPSKISRGAGRGPLQHSWGETTEHAAPPPVCWKKLTDYDIVNRDSRRSRCPCS